MFPATTPGCFAALTALNFAAHKNKYSFLLNQFSNYKSSPFFEKRDNLVLLWKSSPITRSMQKEGLS
jgi:hypothetical protein